MPPKRKRKNNTKDDLERFNKTYPKYNNVDVSSDDRQIDAFLLEPDSEGIPEEDLLPSLSDPLGKLYEEVMM